MADRDLWRRLQAVEDRLDVLVAERRQLYSDIEQNREIIMELGNKQNLLVTRLEETGWLEPKNKIIAVN